MRSEYLPSLKMVLIQVRIAVLSREKGISISLKNLTVKERGTLLLMETRCYRLNYDWQSVQDKTGSEADLFHQFQHKYSFGWDSKSILSGTRFCVS